MNARYLGILTVCILALAGRSATLVEGGEARATLILAADASAPLKQAVGDFQRVLSLISGARLPVSNEPGNAAVRLWIGGHPKLPDWVRLPAGEEAVYLGCQGDDVVIVGEDGGSHEGTAEAVYTFMEEVLDCRWLWPGNLGEVAPRRETVVVAPFTFTHQPQVHLRRPLMLNHRRMLELARDSDGYPPEQAAALEAEVREWYIRQRGGGSGAMNAGHAFTGWYKTYGESSPELFALQPDGSRTPYPKPSCTKLCISNPAVRETWLDQVAVQVAKYPDLRMVSASPNDSGYSGYCVCEHCRAWDAKLAPVIELSWAGQTAQHVALTDRYVRFWNSLAQGLRERFPDREISIGVWAYGATRTPPVEAELDDRIVVGFVGGMPWAADSARAADKALWAAWSAKAKRLIWRPNMFYYRWAMPTLFMHRYAEDFRWLVEHGLQGLIIDSIGNHWAPTGLQYYVIQKLAWDPQADVDSMIDDYLIHGFGPEAAPILRRYVNRLEALERELAEAIEGKTRFEQTFYYSRTYTPSVRAELHTLLDQAKLATSGTAVQRVEFWQRGLDFLDAQIAAVDAMADVRNGRGEFREVVPRAVEACGQRDAMLRASWLDHALGASQYRFLHESRGMRNYLGPPDASYRDLLGDARIVPLPLQWAFRLDPEKQGVSGRWYEADKAAELTWRSLTVSAWWAEQLPNDDPDDPVGTMYLGDAWYRLRFEAPAMKDDEDLELVLGAVDEGAWIYLNGILLASQPYDASVDPDAWKKPRRVRISSHLQPINELVVRVANDSGQGGIWRPCYLRHVPRPLNSATTFGDETNPWRAQADAGGVTPPACEVGPGKFVGEQALEFTLAADGLVSVRRGDKTPLKPGTYLLELRYRQSLTGQLAPEARPLRLRLTAQPADRPPESRDYLWLFSPAESTDDAEWASLSGVFRVEQDAHYMSFVLTVFMDKAGTYQLDEVVLSRLP